MRLAIILVILAVIVSAIFFYNPQYSDKIPSITRQPVQTATPSPIPLPKLLPAKTLQNDYQIFETFNNCGPASLSMDLSFFGIHKTQAELGEALRPFQVVSGDNDDKNVNFDEMGAEAEKYGLIAYHRPDGNIDLIKQFIASDIPVIVSTTLHTDDDIGHFRVVKGYDDTAGEIIQDDSFQGKNIHYSYDDFNLMWSKYNFEYLVLVPKEKQATAERILGDDLDLKTSWQHAVELSQKQLEKNPDDIYARFNLSVADYNIGDYQATVDEYEKVASRLPFRTLWYQIEPIEAYYNLGNYQKVFEMSDKVFASQNRAFSELYILRGQSDLKLGKEDDAKAEFEKAVFYNVNLQAAKDALASVE